MKKVLILMFLILGVSCGKQSVGPSKNSISKNENSPSHQTPSMKRAKKNWKKIKDKLTIVNRFKPKKRLPKAVTAQRNRLFNLSEIRGVIQFPKYTAQEKLDLIKQVQNVLLNHYVNLKVKIDDFGNSVDPTAELESLVDQAAGLSESELHSRISKLFFKLRDRHLNYFLPLPYGCFQSHLPLAFTFVKNDQSEEKIILTHIYDFTKSLALGASHSNLENIKKLKAGLTLTKYNGKPIHLALKDINRYTSGANPGAQRAMALQYLSFRGHKFNFLPEKNQNNLEFMDKNGKKININLPWLTEYVCKEEEDGTLISTYNRYAQAGLQKENSLNKGNTSQNKIDFSSTKSEQGKYLTYATNFNFGYLKVPTFMPNNPEAFDEEMKDFLKKLKNEGVQHLAIDVRNNGGGYIYLAERLAQYLTREKIELSRYRFKNTPNNLLFFGSSIFESSSYKTFIPLARDLQHSDAYYSETSPLITEELMSQSHEFSSSVSFKTINIIADAKCYSACDTFVAQMQDHGSAKIWGIGSKSTGAGGASVKSYSDFLRPVVSHIDGMTVLPVLPGGQDMRFSFLQAVRTNFNAGMMIENDGVYVDEVIYLNEKEVYDPLRSIVTRIIARLQQ